MRCAYSRFSERELGGDGSGLEFGTGAAVRLRCGGKRAQLRRFAVDEFAGVWSKT